MEISSSTFTCKLISVGMQEQEIFKVEATSWFFIAVSEFLWDCCGWKGLACLWHLHLGRADDLERVGARGNTPLGTNPISGSPWFWTPGEECLLRGMPLTDVDQSWCDSSTRWEESSVGEGWGEGNLYCNSALCSPRHRIADRRTERVMHWAHPQQHRL